MHEILIEVHSFAATAHYCVKQCDACVTPETVKLHLSKLWVKIAL